MSATAGSPWSNIPPRFRIFLLVVPIIVAIDQITKKIIEDSYPFRTIKPIIGDFFRLVHYQNEGAAFGILANQPEGFRIPFFVGVSIVAIVVIISLLWKTRDEQKLYTWALSLVLGGAIGNFIDRVTYGHVVDFLDFGFGATRWPAFNVADMAICAGVAFLALDMLKEWQQERRELQAESEKAAQVADTQSPPEQSELVTSESKND